MTKYISINDHERSFIREKPKLKDFEGLSFILFLITGKITLSRIASHTKVGYCFLNVITIS